MERNEESSDCEHDSEMLNSRKFKKRKITGRLKDVNKKMRLRTHDAGDDCACKRLKCFEKISSEERKVLLKNVNQLSSNNEQNLYLCGLISCNAIKRRRPRKEENVALLHDNYFSYRVKIVRNTEILEIPVCFKAFMSIHGISKKKMEHLQKSLKTTGNFPPDLRGKHLNRPRKKSVQTIENVESHIRSFKGCKSHYSLKKTNRLYLSEDLNIAKMHALYGEKFPNLPVSYEFYRNIFNAKFNIFFGYPRKDTCSSCDQFTASRKDLNLKLKNSPSPTVNAEILQSLMNLENGNMLHRKKAQVFYDRKRTSKFKCQKDRETEAICMDFQKNLPVPNITTNDVYYKRQLSIYSFNIHILSSDESVFYVFPETIGNKGSDEVISMLHHFIENYLDQNIKHVEIFCDSCGGQNKNYNLVKYMHYIIHIRKKLESVKMTFPIRGHSYLECDRNMAIINQKYAAELPNDWMKEIEKSRNKPAPFHIEDLEKSQEIIRDWDTFFKQLPCNKKCTFPTRPIREIEASIVHPRLISHRSSFNGQWEKTPILPPIHKRSKPEPVLHRNEFLFPNKKYEGLIPISDKKFSNLQDLKKFCSIETQRYYDNLPHTDKEKISRNIKKTTNSTRSKKDKNKTCGTSKRNKNKKMEKKAT